MSAGEPAPLVVHGWTVFAHPLFLAQIEALARQVEAAAYGAVFLVAGLTWLLGGVVREKVCLAMCPWPRFQAALQAVEARIVARNAERLAPYPYLQPSLIPTSINI